MDTNRIVFAASATQSFWGAHAQIRSCSRHRVCRDLRRFDASYAINTISRTDIEKIAPVNFADLIGQLPGFQTEITGGEVQNIYRIRGLPNDAGDKMERDYMLEKRDGFSNFADKDVRALIYTQTATGAAMLRDMLCRAWAESAIRPVESRPSPIDFANPRFNPETGSAPD